MRPIFFFLLAGDVEILNSSSKFIAAMDFSTTDLYLITSGTLSNYASSYNTTEAANGSFTYLGPYPSNNQYDGTASASAVPEPITLSLFGAGFAGAIAMRRRKKAKA